MSMESDMRACLYVTLLCSLGASGCDAKFWAGYSRANPDDCVTSGSPCAAGMACSQSSHVCELIPDVTAITPALASGAGGIRVQAQGQNFGADTGLWFGQPPGAAATDVSILSDKLLEATLPPNPGDSWAVPVSVGTLGASTTRTGLFSYYARSISYQSGEVTQVTTAEALDAADFNQDGRMDVVTMVSNPPTAAVLFTQANGTFAVGSSVLTPVQTTSIHAVDVNKDAYPDLIVFSGAGIDVYINDQHSKFGARQHYNTDTAATPGPEGPAFGDWNKDGAIDIAVANRLADTVVLVINDGTGAFNNIYSLESGTGVSGAVAGDFDRDGNPDLITLSNSAPVRLYLGDGIGGLNARSDISASGCRPLVGKAADLNEDGRLDLVVSCLDDSSVRVLLGTATGFQGGDTPLQKFKAPPAFALADCDGDKHLDLGIFAPADAALFVRRNDGSGSFGPAIMSAISVGPAGRATTVAGDFNNDGKPDFFGTSSPPALFLNTSK